MYVCMYMRIWIYTCGRPALWTAGKYVLFGFFYAVGYTAASSRFPSMIVPWNSHSIPYSTNSDTMWWHIGTTNSLSSDIGTCTKDFVDTSWIIYLFHTSSIKDDVPGSISPSISPYRVGIVSIFRLDLYVCIAIAMVCSCSMVEYESLHKHPKHGPVGSPFQNHGDRIWAAGSRSTFPHVPPQLPSGNDC